jgi:L-fucose mutarotase
MLFMLKNHSPLHTPDLLYALASMGHGDDLAIVDAHFPADSMAQRLIRLDGANATDTLRACLELIPLDTFVPDPALRMRVVDNPEEVRPIQHEFQQIVNEAEGREIPLKAIDRFGFYERAKAAYAIVLTGELRTYGCVLVKKGVVQ